MVGKQPVLGFGEVQKLNFPGSLKLANAINSAHIFLLIIHLYIEISTFREIEKSLFL